MHALLPLLPQRQPCLSLGDPPGDPKHQQIHYTLGDPLINPERVGGYWVEGEAWSSGIPAWTMQHLSHVIWMDPN